MVTYLNESGVVYVIITKINTNITGDESVTFFSLIALAIVIMSAFRIPLEVQALLLVPLVLVLMAYSSTYLLFGGIVLAFIAFILVKALL